MGNTSTESSRQKVYYSPTPGWKPSSDPSALVIYITPGSGITTGQTSQGNNVVPAGLPVQEQGSVNGKPIGNIGNYIINTIKNTPQKTVTTTSINQQYLPAPNSNQTQVQTSNYQQTGGFSSAQFPASMSSSNPSTQSSTTTINVKQFYPDAVLSPEPSKTVEGLTPADTPVQKKESVWESVKSGKFYEGITWVASGFGLFGEGPKVGDIPIPRLPYETKGTASSSSMPITTTIREQQQYDILAEGYNIPIESRAKNVEKNVVSKYTSIGKSQVDAYAASQQEYLNENIASLQTAVNAGTISQQEAQNIADIGVSAANKNISEYSKQVQANLQSSAQTEYNLEVNTIVSKQNAFNQKYSGINENISPVTAAEFTTFLFAPPILVTGALMISGASRIGTGLRETGTVDILGFEIPKSAVDVAFGTAETAFGFYGASKIISNYENAKSANKAVEDAFKNQNTMADIESGKIHPFRVEKSEGGFTEYFRSVGYSDRTKAIINTKYEVSKIGDSSEFYTGVIKSEISIEQLDYLTGKYLNYGAVQVTQGLGEIGEPVVFKSKIFGSGFGNVYQNAEQVNYGELTPFDIQTKTFKLQDGQKIFKSVEAGDFGTIAGLSTKQGNYVFSISGEQANVNEMFLGFKGDVKGVVNYDLVNQKYFKVLTMKSSYSDATFDFEPFGNTGLKANLGQISEPTTSNYFSFMTGKKQTAQLSQQAVVSGIQESGAGAAASLSSQQMYSLNTESFQTRSISIGVNSQALKYFQLTAKQKTEVSFRELDNIFLPDMFRQSSFQTQFQLTVPIERQNTQLKLTAIKPLELMGPTASPIFDFSFTPKFPFPFALPDINLNEGYRSRQGGKRGFRYSPSIAALGLGITSNKIPFGTWTGIVMRPQIKRRKKK